MTNLTGYDLEIGVFIILLLIYGIGYCLGYKAGKKHGASP
jgi:hypothetical protein